MMDSYYPPSSVFFSARMTIAWLAPRQKSALLARAAIHYPAMEYARPIVGLVDAPFAKLLPPAEAVI